MTDLGAELTCDGGKRTGGFEGLTVREQTFGVREVNSQVRPSSNLQSLRSEVCLSG